METKLVSLVSILCLTFSVAFAEKTATAQIIKGKTQA